MSEGNLATWQAIADSTCSSKIYTTLCWNYSVNEGSYINYTVHPSIKSKCWISNRPDVKVVFKKDYNPTPGPTPLVDTAKLIQQVYRK